jgi:hypothetical protein
MFISKMKDLDLHLAFLLEGRLLGNLPLSLRWNGRLNKGYVVLRYGIAGAIMPSMCSSQAMFTMSPTNSFPWPLA